MDDSLVLGTDIMLRAVRQLAVIVLDERRRTFIAWPYTNTPLNNETKHKKRGGKVGWV
jgi:hypothetical protein